MRNLALAVLVLLAAGCDRQAPSGPSRVGVSGRVVDFASGVGVPGGAVAFGEMTAMTDANGRYTIEHLTSGQYEPRVDGVWMGQSRVTGPAYRADFLAHPGTCVSRYGTLADARTRNPVVGATVRFVGPGLSDSTVSGSDGWYRIDLGCPANGLVGFNTTMIAASHPQYLDASQSVGRGVGGATRLDLDLEPDRRHFRLQTSGINFKLQAFSDTLNAHGLEPHRAPDRSARGVGCPATYPPPYWRRHSHADIQRVM